jgi:vesicle-associated membrane protein-associated protein A
MSTKQEQILKINPPVELTFTGPFHQAVSSVMTLTNPSERKVCFKIKTTAPKRYCVKPNSGVIDPSDTVQIAVSLQPFDFDPTDKNRHKFMVQSMYAPPGEINQESLWKEADGSQLMDSKLKCLFVLPETNGGVNEPMSGNRDSWQSTSGNGDSPQIKQENEDNIAVRSAPESGSSVPPSVPSRQGEMIASRPAEFQQTVHDPMCVMGPRVTSNDLPISPSQVFKLCPEHLQPIPQGGDVEIQLKKSVEKIQELNAEVSAARQDNLQLKEKILRMERLGSTTQDPPSTRPTGSESYTLHARNPDADSLSTTYLYLALLVLVIGIILGKFVF